jgi:hypothetical protein
MRQHSQAHAKSNTKNRNTFSENIYSRYTTFILNSEDAISEFWEFFLLNSETKYDNLSDVVRTIFALAEAQLGMGLECDVFIEESEDYQYFTMTNMNRLPEKVIELMIKKNKLSCEYKISDDKVSFELIKLCSVDEFEEELVEEVKEIKVDNTLINTLIHNVKKTIIPKIVLEENNQTSELNTSVEKSQTVEITKVKIPEVKVVKSFKITTESKVWFGYIDMLTHKKRQKTFKGEFDLDPTKRWLLLFGHGFIDMYVNGEIVKFNSREYTRFIYEDSELRIIDKKEFNELNRGSQW